MLYLRSAFIWCLGLGLTACGGGSGSPGGGSGGGGTGSGTLFLQASPSAPIMLPGSTLTFLVSGNTLNETAAPTIISAQLPSGITTSTPLPLAIPGGGAPVTLMTPSNIAAGTYTVVLSGKAGSATANLKIPITIQTANLPAFYFATPLFDEVALPAGGSGQIQLVTGTNGTPQYNVVLTATGLPASTTASFNPQVVVPGGAVTVTLNATTNAPPSQNVRVAIMGTPLAPIAPASTNILASVTAPQGAMINNWTNYISTDANLNSAVYDPLHGLIFASNTAWNRVDIVSNASHTIIGSVNIPDPLGIDISQDSSTVWVATGSQQVFGINTTTFNPTRYQLPGLGPSQSNGSQTWQGNFIFALSDGTLMIYSGSLNSNSFTYFSIWNPKTNILTPISSPANAIPGVVLRSGNGARIYSISSDSSGRSFYYDVGTKQFSGIFQLGGFALSGGINNDGSRVAVNDENGLNMYDGNFNLIGPLPGGGLGGLPFEGGLVFSPTTGDLYETALPDDLAVILTIDPNSLQVLTAAPAMGIPGGDNLPDVFIPTPFAVDSTGTVLGLQIYGIAFDDSTFAQNFSPLQPGFPQFLNHMSPYVGPLAGGTTSGGFGNAFNINPGVWYGQVQGIATNTNNDLTITSPPSNAPGPVNIKFLFPDGTEVFDPLFFSYGPLLEHEILSGASPDGGVPGEVSGFGLPNGSDGGTLTVGGAAASIANPPTSFAPTSGAPFPTDTILSFTIPAGSPGYADVALTTSTGQSTLSKAIFYAQSVKDYSSSGDVFSSVLYDASRQQLYLSAGDHIDVFSLSSNQFVSPLTPPAVGSSKGFAGLTLTPDGSQLLATDLLDGSLAVVNPDNPTTSYAIAIAPVTGQGCVSGPLYVQGPNDNTAFVLAGGMPGPGCGPGGSLFQVNLTSRSAQFANPGRACSSGGTSLGASADGSLIVMGGDGLCVYNLLTKTYLGNTFLQAFGGTISGDGNAVAAQYSFFDTTPNLVGMVARPDVYQFTSINPPSPLLQPKLNDSGSLYYMPYGNFFDVIDVQHETLRMRFSLSEQISNAATPMAIDSGGRQ